MANDTYDNAQTDKDILKKIQAKEQAERILKETLARIIKAENHALDLLEKVRRDKRLIEEAFQFTDDLDRLAAHLASHDKPKLQSLEIIDGGPGVPALTMRRMTHGG